MVCQSVGWFDCGCSQLLHFEANNTWISLHDIACVPGRHYDLNMFETYVYILYLEIGFILIHTEHYVSSSLCFGFAGNLLKCQKKLGFAECG